MEPPSYEEANLHPPNLNREGFDIPPPPSYTTSIASPPTPPPTYGEVVQSDPFPVLTSLTASPAVTSSQQNTGVIVHPHTQIGIAPTAGTHQPQVAVVIQPLPVPVSVMYLTDIPGLVNCPHCHHTVTTKVTYVPGTAAWCTCVLLALMGFICGCCLIPFAIRGLQDVQHSCPHCRNVLHIYRN